MANNKLNKSQAIREFLEQNPKATATEAKDQLAQKKIKVSSQLFYTVKGKLSQISSHKRKKAARVAKATEKIGNMDSIALIVKVKALAKEASGMHNLKALVDVLAD